MNTSAAPPTEPSVPALRRVRWFAGVRGADWEMIGWVLAIKALLLTFGIQAVAAMTQKHRGWLELWNNWDAMHYLRLAEHGYVAAGDGRVSLVFFPLYPWLVRLTAFVARDYMLAAFIVSGFASVAAALLLRRLARCDETEAVSRNAVWFFLIFPTSYFLSSVTPKVFSSPSRSVAFWPRGSRTGRWPACSVRAPA